MCDPVTITATTVAVLGAVSSYQQGVEAKKTSRYNARVLENEAIRTRNKGVTEEMRHREQVQQLISKQRATAGASGVDVNQGSPLQLQEDAELFGEVDALTIRNNFGDQANALDQRAELTLAEGDSAYRRGVTGAVTALAGAAIGAGVAGSAGGAASGAAGSQGGTAVSSTWYAQNSSAATQNMFRIPGGL